MQKLKAAAAAVVALAGVSASFSAGAVTTLAIPSTTSLGASFVGAQSFDNVFTFEIASSAYAAVSGSSTSTVLSIPAFNLSGTLSGIGGLGVWLDGIAVAVNAAPAGLVTGTFSGTPTTTQTTVYSFALAPLAIAAGQHTVQIKGLVNGSNGGAYSAELSLTPVATLVSAPVPEPETYAMMLAGLGALGFLASRRRG